MADENTTPEGSETEQGSQETVEQQSKPEIPKEVQAALRKANKEAESLRLKLKEFEDRDKTELQKLAERAELAEKESATRAHELLRLQVAAEKGLNAAQARRLVGSTREELEADAAELAEMLTPEQPRRRVPDLKQGARGSLPQPDENDLFRQYLGGRH